MNKYYTITLVPGTTSPGPYTIYLNQVNGTIPLLYPSLTNAENIDRDTLLAGVTIQTNGIPEYIVIFNEYEYCQTSITIPTPTTSTIPTPVASIAPKVVATPKATALISPTPKPASKPVKIAAPNKQTNAGETKAAAPKVQTIFCYKGKLLKKVTAAKPVCPKGYVKR